MRFNTIIALVSVGTVLGQATTTNTTATTAEVAPDAVTKCLADKKCGTDVTCAASCVGVPSPTNDQIAQTNQCFQGCNNTLPTQEYIDCTAKCTNIFNSYPGQPQSGNGGKDGKGDGAKGDGTNGKDDKTKDDSKDPKSSGSIAAATPFLSSLVILGAGLVSFSQLL